MKSLERNFVTGLAIVLIVAFSVLLWASVSAVKSLSEAYITTRLEHDAEALLSAFAKHPRGGIRLREGRIIPVYQQPLSGHYYQFTFSDGSQLRSRSLWDEILKPVEVSLGEIKTYTDIGPGKQQLLLRSAGYEKAGLRFTLTVAEDMEPMTDDIRYFQLFSLTLLGLTALTIILILRYLLRRGFRALDHVRDEVQQISSGKAQLLRELGPSEIQPLTSEINRLLNQLQQRLRRSRDALGNLAHALKGPISLLTHEIDSLQLPTTQRKNLALKLTRISSLIDRELKRARFAGEDVGRHFVADTDLPDLIQALQQLYPDRNIEVTTGSLPDYPLYFDHEDMLELLGNLLDNAFKWAKSKINIELTINHGMQILVADDGPGVNEKDRALMLQRGIRIDEQEAGHGLGLAIVNDLISDYKGKIDFSRSEELGGLQVKIQLPMPHTSKTA